MKHCFDCEGGDCQTADIRYEEVVSSNDNLSREKKHSKSNQSSGTRICCKVGLNNHKTNYCKIMLYENVCSLKIKYNLIGKQMKTKLKPLFRISAFSVWAKWSGSRVLVVFWYFLGWTGRSASTSGPRHSPSRRSSSSPATAASSRWEQKFRFLNNCKFINSFDSTDTEYYKLHNVTRISFAVHCQKHKFLDGNRTQVLL